ncbi:hypothetical protein PENSPDRAFT_423015 [Peniophora sp. CONT]|nr:hypothetical protein PENSPDRAFT_423015 [Peniophora sp. CONT]
MWIPQGREVDTKRVLLILKYRCRSRTESQRSRLFDLRCSIQLLQLPEIGWRDRGYCYLLYVTCGSGLKFSPQLSTVSREETLAFASIGD